MNSTDMTYAGVSTLTPPAVGLRGAASADSVVRMAPCAAPQHGTALPVPAGRLRALVAAGGTAGVDTTGAPFGTDALPFLERTTPIQRTTPKGRAVAGVAFRHISSTPGDLPPEDPLS